MTATDAAVRLARRLIDEHGTPAPMGSPVEQLLVVDMSVRQIADLVNLSPGTVQRHMSRLDVLGVRVNQRVYSNVRLLEFETASGPVISDSVPGVATPVAEDVLGAFAALCDLVAASPSSLPQAQLVATQLLRDVSEPPREDARPDRASDVANRAVSGRVSSRGLDLDLLTNRPIDESVHVDPREEASRGSRSREDTLALVKPLVEACDRLGLPGVTDSAELAKRLRFFEDDQIRYAVSKLLVEANGGLAKPIGKLANIAAEGSMDYFPTTPPSVRLPGDERVDVFVVPPADLGCGDTDVGEGEPSLSVEEHAARHQAGMAQLRRSLGPAIGLANV